VNVTTKKVLVIEMTEDEWGKLEREYDALADRLNLAPASNDRMQFFKLTRAVDEVIAYD
jgi:hypothetical protein